MDIAEKMQFYVRELLHKDGKISMLKISSETQAKETTDLKEQVKKLEKQLKEESEKSAQLKKEIKQVQMDNKENMHHNLRDSIKGQISKNGGDKSIMRKSRSKLLIQKKPDNSQNSSVAKESSHSSDARGWVINNKNDSDSNDTSFLLTSMKKVYKN